MKYSCEVIIDLPRDKVIELFNNTDNLFKWQEGLQTFELVSGEKCKKGAKSRMVYEIKGKKIIMMEEILLCNFPEEFSAVYKTKGIKNITINKFVNTSDIQTIWILENEFEFKGIMRFMGLFLPRAFKEQTIKDMMNFKEFAEKELN